MFDPAAQPVRAWLCTLENTAGKKGRRGRPRAYSTWVFSPMHDRSAGPWVDRFENSPNMRKRRLNCAGGQATKDEGLSHGCFHPVSRAEAALSAHPNKTTKGDRLSYRSETD